MLLTILTSGCYFTYSKNKYRNVLVFISERNMRMIQIQENMAEQKKIKDKLENEQEKLHVEYNKVNHVELFAVQNYLKK